MHKTFIIAEIGVNHNGKLKLAQKLIIEAKKAGADCVKFQTFNTDELVTKWSPKAEYQNKKDKKTNQYQMLKKYELSYKEQIQLKKFCRKKKIEFLSSAFSLSDINFLKKIKLKKFKIPSGEITNYFYLKKIGSMNKTTLLSTGMANLDEISAAIRLLISSGLQRKKLIILHCISEYPTSLNKLNLNFIRTLKNKFKLQVGLSDHSKSLIVPAIAVSLGAKIIEKHLTLNSNMNGPDHTSSLNPTEFKKMVMNIRETEMTLGKNDKVISHTEMKNKRVVRKSLVAKKEIKIGQIIKLNDLNFKRPGNGISPMDYKKVIGKKSKKNYKKDDLI